MKHALTLLACMLASPAFAGSPCTDMYPPSEYRLPGAPEAYGIELVRLSPSGMRITCGKGRNGRPVLGCSRGDGRIYIEASQTGNNLRCLIVHELAHEVMGWVHPPQWMVKPVVSLGG